MLKFLGGFVVGVVAYEVALIMMYAKKTSGGGTGLDLPQDDKGLLLNPPCCQDVKTAFEPTVSGLKQRKSAIV